MAPKHEAKSLKTIEQTTIQRPPCPPELYQHLIECIAPVDLLLEQMRFPRQCTLHIFNYSKLFVEIGHTININRVFLLFHAAISLCSHSLQQID